MKRMQRKLSTWGVAFLCQGICFVSTSCTTVTEKGPVILYEQKQKGAKMSPLFGNNVNEYYVNLVRQNFNKRSARLAAIQTPQQAEAYAAEIREKLKKIFQFPERTPLNAVVTGKNSYPGYTVENLYYYSRPGYPVTANLYLPAKFDGKLRAVLMLCGHSGKGKGDGDYRRVCIHLALNGFAVLIPDPVEQGERQQYRSFEGKHFGLCGNHNLMAKNLILCGEWFGAWRTWDAIRGLDYLQTRTEIDPEKLYVTGNSGGGTLTTLVAAADKRPIAVAPSCYVTSWKHNIENELPADFEQIPPHALELGLEMGDLLLAQAPRSIMILGQKNDFFDPRGVVETFNEVKKINGLLGGKTEYFIGPCGHGFSRENREAMYQFFSGEKYSEPQIQLPPYESTFALPEGKLENLKDNQMLRALTEKIASGLAAKRRKLSPEQTKLKLRELLALDAPKVPHYRVLRQSWGPLTRNRFALETENDSITSILVHYSKDIFFYPETKVKKLTVYVAALDSKEEMKDRELKEGENLFAIEPRGIGEMTPSGTDQYDNRNFFAPYFFDYHYASVAIMFGKNMLGRRVYDILCALELLGKDGAEITLEARGLGCIPALMAGVLSDKVKHVKFTDMPISYTELLNIPVSDFPLSFMVPEILRYFDLPDLQKLLSDQKEN